MRALTHKSKAKPWQKAKIFHMCLKQGSVADELKVARVNPIYKCGSKVEFPATGLFLFFQYVLKFLKRLYYFRCGNEGLLQK